MATILANLERFMQASQPPRFSRTPTSGTAPVAPARPAVSSPTPNGASAGSDDATMQRYQTLKTQGEALKSSRDRAAFHLEQADKAIETCQQQALELFQVNSLEELEAAIARQQAQDQDALDAYEKDLQAEAARQQTALDKLQVLDRPV